MMPSDSIKPSRFLLASLLCIGLVAPASAQQGEGPLFPVGVRYDPGTKSGDEIRSELKALGASGFNVISIALQPDKPETLRRLVELGSATGIRALQIARDGAPSAPGSLTGPPLRLWAWTAIAKGERSIIFDEPSETAAAFARVVTRNSALFRPLRPRQPAGPGSQVLINGGDGTVEVRFLDSPDVIMMVGLNHSDRAQNVTMTFAPDTQEAIWQNIETGSSVNFVAGTAGPSYTYRFAPHDVFVLMIRRAIR